jgi:predicted kinase
VHSELALARKRLYQGRRIVIERDADTRRRRDRRDLHGLAAIDTIGNGVIIDAARAA